MHLVMQLFIFYAFIYQYIFTVWAGYKICILPQRPEEHRMYRKTSRLRSLRNLWHVPIITEPHL